jgi:hypothetical protein
LLRSEKRCYPRDRARVLVVASPISGEAFSALSGPDTCHCSIAIQAVSISADVCVPIVREKGALVQHKAVLLGPFQLENNFARHCLDIKTCWKFAQLGRSVCKYFIVFMFHTASKRQVLAQNRKLPDIDFKNKDFSGHEKRD